jgi:hypothetical protein
MIWTIVSRWTHTRESINQTIGTPLYIKVPQRNFKEQPILGFRSFELGCEYMKTKNIPQQDYEVVSVQSGIASELQNKPIFVFQSIEQIGEIDEDTEGYDYEKFIL